MTYETRNYISSASARAGAHSDFFQESTSALWDNRELQFAYHEFASSLSNEDLDNFVQASVNAGGQLGDFIQITNELIAEAEYFPKSNVGYQEDTLQKFLSLSQDAESQDLQGFITLLGELDSDPDSTGIEGYWDNSKYINGLRSSFIQVAYESGLELSELNQLGNQALALGEERFQDIFGMDNLVAGNTNLSVEDYEDLIKAAETQDDATWDNTGFSVFYRDYPGIDQLI